MKMSNQGNVLGRIQDNWRQRAGECTTFRAELRVIPRWPIRVLVSLYILALAVVTATTLYVTNAVPQDIVEKPVAIKLLAMYGIVTGIAVVISIVVLVLSYVWADARRRGMSPVLWLLVALLVPYGIGTILYFVVREPLSRNCPQCGHAVNPHFNFCPACQFNLLPNCPQCRRAVRAGDRFCPYCGATVQADVAAPVSTQKA
ncbi:MAG TPA: zinc ribbon domain-containing protein [Terriglobia bacterium]|nr:zinc ribbon domain-containing protein [Terriglobia bacterium]